MMDYVNAFWVGGLICVLVQILMEKTKMMPGCTRITAPNTRIQPKICLPVMV